MVFFGTLPTYELEGLLKGGGECRVSELACYPGWNAATPAESENKLQHFEDQGHQVSVFVGPVILVAFSNTNLVLLTNGHVPLNGLQDVKRFMNQKHTK